MTTEAAEDAGEVEVDRPEAEEASRERTIVHDGHFYNCIVLYCR